MHCTDCGAAIPPGTDACLRCAASADRLDQTVVGRPTDFPGVDDLLTRLRRDLSGEYEVHGMLGRGGMAVVYKATELELLRPVALKVLPPELSASTAMAERFRREARLAAGFDHPNIIPIYRVGQAGGVFYIAMKFIEGKPLDDLIESQGPLPIAVVLHVLRAAVRALAFAHQHGVVHRDIKGANILIDQDGRVVVSDFGIARAGEDAGMTATGTLMGTPYYMSPEQCAGHRVGQQSDQYSMGVVAFQMLTGSVPFRAETIPGVMQHHFFTPPPDLRAVRADVPDALVEVVQRALSKRASDRYATTREMQEAVDAIPFPERMRQEGEALLRDLVLGVPVKRVDAGALPPLQETMLMTPPGGVVKPAPRRAAKPGRRGLAMGAAAGVVALTGIGWAMTQNVGAPPAAPTVPSPATRAQDSTMRSGTARLAGRADTAGQPEQESRAATPVANAPARTRQPAAAMKADPVAAPKPEPVRQVVLDASNAGKLRVRVMPSDAEIRVDGRVLGRGVVLDSLLGAGSRRLQAAAAGYHPIDTVIVVTAGGTAQVGTLRLLPLERQP